MTGYFLSLDADNDLQDIYAYSEETWGERQAERYVRGFFDVFEHIGRNPLLGRLRTELGEGIRSFPCRSHVVFFMQRRDRVAIIRVLHGARDSAGLFEDYDPIPGVEAREP